ESYEQTDTVKENFQTSKRPLQDKAEKPSAIVPTDGPTDAEMALCVDARNFISDNKTFNEFLKLFRSFTQGEIATEVLLEKAANFIGSDRGQMHELRRFVGWEGSYERIRNAGVNTPKQRPLKTITFQMVPTTELSYRLLEKSPKYSAYRSPSCIKACLSSLHPAVAFADKLPIHQPPIAINSGTAMPQVLP
ncbi:Transcriptional regulatory protein sin3, partial [Rhizina undulata]